VSRYSLLKSPLWIAGIVIALVAIVAFVNLGMWQLRRLDERRAINATIEERAAADPVRLGVAVATHGTDPEALIYRRVVVAGEYDAAGEVMVVGTTLGGRSGHDVVTPFRSNGLTIGVNRGWVPIDTDGPPAVGAEPPLGPVEAVGVLLASQTFGSLGTPEADGAYDRVGRIDLGALSPQWGGEVLTVYLLLEEETPAGGGLPVPRPPPQPSEGPHLGYAIQWFFFAVIVAVGFPALVYRTGR
jgi:surfeit locus 1 family protein